MCDVAVLLLSAVRFYGEALSEALARMDIGVVRHFDTLDPLAPLLASKEAVVIVDTAMEDAIRTIRAIADRHTRTRVIAIGVRERSDDLQALADAGATAFVSSEATVEDIAAATVGARRGLIPHSSRTVAALIHRAAEALEPPREADRPMTPRERQILRLIAEGLANKQIARRLGISLSTVKNHVHRILHKLDVENRAQAAARYIEGRLPHRRERSYPMSASEDAAPGHQ